MARKRSQRRARKLAKDFIASTAPKRWSSDKLRLPKAKLAAPDANPIKHLAEAKEAADCLKILKFADNPIETFNQFKDSQKEVVMKNLLQSVCILREGGANLAPADTQYYSQAGLPEADWALLRGAQLCNVDNDVDENEKYEDESEEDEEENEEDGEENEEDEENDRNPKIHGEPCWPPNVDISGSCSKPVCMDDTGRVDLQHDPYCLRKHFATRWAVLKDESVRGPPQRARADLEWEDNEFSLVTEGKNTGLGIDASEPDFVRRACREAIPLTRLISSPLLLYRLVSSFGAPPWTPPCKSVDSHERVWSFTLWHHDDPTCSLEISEHKGWPVASFCGGPKASNEALQLIEWLTSYNCPHPYDYLHTLRATCMTSISCPMGIDIGLNRRRVVVYREQSVRH